MDLGGAHLIVGLLVFAVFAVTGKFMHADFPDKEIIAQEFRLLMRSRHIYNFAFESYSYSARTLFSARAANVAQNFANHRLDAFNFRKPFAHLRILLRNLFAGGVFQFEPLRFVYDACRNGFSFIQPVSLE